MKHIDYNAKSRTQRTSSDWLRVGANIAEVANDWAARTDLVAFIGEGATSGLAPALFRPEIAEIEINIEKAFGFGVNADQVGDFKKSDTRYEFPRATGAILHEAFHARFSRWSIEKANEDLAKDEMTALMLLEESRIEKFGLDLNKTYRAFLRATALEIVIGDLKSEQLSELTIANAVQLIGLVNARVVAGVLLADEVAEITSILRGVVGEDAFIRFLELADAFQQHRNHFVIEGAYPIAKEWAKLLRDLQEANGEEPAEQGEGEGEGAGTPSEGEGEGKSISKAMQELLDALENASEEVEFASTSELYDQQRDEEWAEEVESRKSESKERSEARDVASDVFGQGTGETAGNGTYSRLTEERLPESKERSAAVIVARLLEKAKYRERDIVEITSQIPQGRLRTRAAMQNSAQRAMGQLPTANQWERRIRKHTDEPTLNVGVMVDISGSMRPAMGAMATTAWVMSEAVRRVQGKAAMVYYGQDVFPTLKAGQHLDGVKVYTANDPTEKFDKAFKALDGSLNLLHGNGARLLVVVSDGVYTDAECRNATKWVKRCEQQGVAVLWLTFQDRHNQNAESLCKGTKAVVLSGRLDPADAAVEIGKAAARALEISNAG